MSLSQETQNDQVDVQCDNFYSEVRTRNMIESEDTYDKFPPLTSVPANLKMNFDKFVNKPFYVGALPWTTANTAFTDLASTTLVPNSLLVNSQLKAPFEFAAKYRLKACFLLQVTGTPMHQGTLLASVVPAYCVATSSPCLNSNLQAPHAFLSANEATPVCVEIPFYSNTKLRLPDVATNNIFNYGLSSNYAKLNLTVLNPLSTSGTGSTTLTVSIHVIFKEAEFYVPANTLMTWVSQAQYVSSFFDSTAETAKSLAADFIDRIRGTVRRYTGLHNPNVPVIHERMLATPRNMTNNVDIPTFFEKLDPYTEHNRTVEEPTFYTHKDEMLVSNIVQKPQYVGTFNVGSQTTGSLLWSRPITPYQEPITTNNPRFTVPMQTLYMMSKYWKGDIKLHIQAVMTNFHNVKLMVARNYVPDARLAASYPTYLDAVALQTTTLEFSGGGQVQTLDLKFCSEVEQVATSIDPVVNALSHGMYYIYLAQPLVASASVPTTVSFNVYISGGDDLEFYGYSMRTFALGSRSGNAPPSFEEGEEFEAHSVLVEPTSQVNLENKSANIIANNKSKNFRPIVSTREYFRRFVPSMVFPIQSTPTTTQEWHFTTLSVDHMLKKINDSDTLVNFQRIMRNFYLGHTGGMRFKFHFYGVQDATVRYIPPTQAYSRFTTPSVGFTYTTGEHVPPAGAQADAWIARQTYPEEYASGAFLSDDYTATPYVETGSWTKPFVSEGNSVGGSTTTTSQIQIECTIPNMNNMEFIGDYSYFNSAEVIPSLYTSALGSFQFACLYQDAAGSPGDFQSFVTIHMSYADECRMGFNVCAPVLIPPVVPATTDKQSADLEYYRTYDATGTVKNVPLNADSVAAKAYYTQT